MDIVKQRRKRLLAWILTITLCVGMWQGSAYATEGDESGTVSGNEVEDIVETEVEERNETVTEVEDIIVTESVKKFEDSAVAPEVTVDYGVKMASLEDENVMPVENNGNICITLYDTNDELKMFRTSEANEIGLSSNLLGTWNVGASGYTYECKDYSKTVLDNVEFTGRELIDSPFDFKHSVVQWKYVPNKDSAVDEVTLEGNTLDLSSVKYDEANNRYDIKAILGKSVVVNLWIADSEEVYKLEFYQKNSKDESWTGIVPSPKSLNNSRGEFFIGWYWGDELLLSGEEFGGTYDDSFERFYESSASYSNSINENKECSLVPWGEYWLYFNGTYKVTKDAQEDEYTYYGNSDSPVYVCSEGMYTFKKLEVEE